MAARTTAFALLMGSLALASCGKAKEQAPESKVAEPGGGGGGGGGGGDKAGGPGDKPADKQVAVADSKPAAPPAKAPSRGAERAVYSLIDNRLSAHLTRGGGLLVNGASAGMAKYMRFGSQLGGESKKAWTLRQTQGDVKVAKLSGKTGSLFVPLTAKEAQTATIRARWFSPYAGTLGMRINESKDVNSQLTEGWQTVEVTVPAGRLKEGENQIAFFAKKSDLALAWMQVGGATAPTDDGGVMFYDQARKALDIPQGGAMSWFVSPPDKTKLTADITDGNCTVNVLATAEDGSTVDGKLTGTGSAVDLASMAGKAVRLDLETTGCAHAQMTAANLVVPGTAPEIKKGAPPKYVVFVIMDSLRADHVKAFNPTARAETPNFDKLAENSSLFEHNFVQGNESQVSHASMWTSMYLAKHKAKDMKDILPEKYVTIAEVAKKGGKYTIGVSANGYIRPKRGFGHSWDKFENHIETPGGLKGADVYESGMKLLTPKHDQPWFMYLGMIDTHVTLRPKEPWMSKYDANYTGKYKQYGDDGTGVPKGLSDKDKDHVRAIYDSNVSYQDDLVGQLLAQLDKWGITDQTMIILTADHGDEHWEDGRFGHGGSIRETLQHVPLVIHYPPMFPTGKFDIGTEGIDIVPTIADALGVAVDPEWQGTSLIPLANGQVVYPQMSFGSRYESGHGGRIGHWKVALYGAAQPKVYDFSKDKDEQKDIYDSAHIGERLLLDPMWMLRQWAVEWKKSQWGNAANVSSRFAADLGE